MNNEIQIINQNLSRPISHNIPDDTSNLPKELIVE